MALAVSIAEMLAAEERALRQGWTHASLLAAAGEALGHAIGRFFPQTGTAIAYLGKGHNAGDAIIALRVLRDAYGWLIGCRHAYPPEAWSPLLQQHANALGGSPTDRRPDPARLRHPLLLIDGLLGTGGSGVMRPELAALAREINQLRQQHGAQVAAVDLPSGVDADSGISQTDAIVADATFMIGSAKIGLLGTPAAAHVGALSLVELDALRTEGSGPLELIAPQTLDFAKSPRPHAAHKDSCGRVQLLAGSSTYPGAAALAAIGCLRAGAGRTTLWVPADALARVHALCPPEIIVRGYAHPAEIPVEAADARVIGCGLGRLPDEQANMLFDWIAASAQPTVLDADALNLIARHGRHDLLQPSHILTPHAGEFARLAPDLATLGREESCTRFSQRHDCTLLLKGSRSLISSPGRALRCNSTGHAGMAVAGQGDLLSGVIGATLASGLSPHDAASLGAWLCGRAAEIALRAAGSPHSMESLSPRDVSVHLGGAWRDWQAATR